MVNIKYILADSFDKKNVDTEKWVYKFE